jgi:hypothetical protein
MFVAMTCLHHILVSYKNKSMFNVGVHIQKSFNSRAHKENVMQDAAKYFTERFLTEAILIYTPKCLILLPD